VRKILPVLVIVVLVYGYGLYQDYSVSRPSNSQAETSLQQAFSNRQSDIQVKGAGTVVKLLRDDLERSRHQKFILQLSSGQTLLISHNIDLAPRVRGLKEGDRVEFYGEYEWNPQGGVIHWTHHDPGGRHVGGWLKHQGNIYQ
jgi:hypothetical protein